MKIIILTIGLFCVASSVIKAQEKIIYTFSQPVLDTLQNGIKYYENAYHKLLKDLKLYAVVVERDGNIGIYLQEYSRVHLRGVLNLIKNSNRVIQANSNLLIPVVFPSDRLSTQTIDDSILDLPLAGFYISIIYDKYKVQTIQTTQLF